MRAVRYTGAVLTAGVLAVAVVTVAAAHTDRTATSSIVVHVDADTAPVHSASGAALAIHVTVGTDRQMLLTVDGRWSDGTGPVRTLSFHGRPSVSAMRMDPDLGSGSLTALFAATDGTVHRLRVDLRAGGDVDAWTDGPFSPEGDGFVAALSTCDARALDATVALHLDGIVVGPGPVSPAAEIVARSCSTVAIHR